MVDDQKKWLHWAVALIASSFVANEKRRQRKLTRFPKVYHQNTTENSELVSLLSAVLLRRLRPSLFIGTRPILNTLAGALPKYYKSNRFREVIKISCDGATIALDWEVPRRSFDGDNATSLILNGPIQRPVVLILHGVFNDTSNGYIRAIMHSCTERGYIAVGMNSRGCGGNKLSTPRMHNAAYTNDLRDVVNRICSRLGKGVPLVLVGYSMGANTIVKYLGECGLSNCVPENIIGAVSLGNPMKIDDDNIKTPWTDILRLGAKKALLQHRNEMRKCPHFKANYRKALLASTFPEVISINVQRMIRNETIHPFDTKIGYETIQKYWDDASCYKYIAHVTVPLVVSYASDDDIASRHTSRFMNFGLSNPNVIFVNTATGGHLGWHHAMKNNPFGPWIFSSSNEDSKGWGNKFVIKFVDVVIAKKFHEETARKKETERKLFKAVLSQQCTDLQSKL